MTQKIAYQGEPGAYSHLACSEYYPDYEPMACPSFDHAFAAVRNGEAAKAMIPVENSLAGRVSDIYHLLPNGGLSINAEYYVPVRHCLLGLKGADIKEIIEARSHPMALGQVRHSLKSMNIKPVQEVDTAGSARLIAERNDPRLAAVASSLAAEIYDLDILKSDIQDEDHNTTRFFALSLTPNASSEVSEPCRTSFVFRVKNRPAALYKALGGFATNGINMTKLESYMLDGSFQATMFYADVEAHPDSDAMHYAMEELEFYSTEIKYLGTYPVHGAAG